MKKEREQARAPAVSGHACPCSSPFCVKNPPKNESTSIAPFVYQQKEERGEFLVSPGHDKELDLCKLGAEPKICAKD